MKEKTRVRLHTAGRLNWAEGKTGVIEVTESAMAPEGTLVVRIDGMDISTPPFGLANVYVHEVEILPEKEEEKDMVNHPSHYTDGKYEVIDYMESRGYFHDAYVFNAVKYISRAGKKDPDKEKEDIQKAIWYLERRKANNKRRPNKEITINDYIQDKNLQGTLKGFALELIDKCEYDLAIKALKMEAENGC